MQITKQNMYTKINMPAEKENRHADDKKNKLQMKTKSTYRRKKIHMQMEKIYMQTKQK